MFPATTETIKRKNEKTNDGNHKQKKTKRWMMSTTETIKQTSWRFPWRSKYIYIYIYNCYVYIHACMRACVGVHKRYDLRICRVHVDSAQSAVIYRHSHMYACRFACTNESTSVCESTNVPMRVCCIRLYVFRDFKDGLAILRIRHLVPRILCCVVFNCSAILRIEGCLNSTL